MAHVHVVTTGGTIAMQHETKAEGAIPILGPDDLRAMLPPIAGDVHFEAVCNLPSAHFTLDTLWAIRQRVAALAATPDVRGLVVTHGTDVLEETAYLLDLTVPGDTPLVVTGAMRSASDPGYEGAANLLAAVRVAADESARGLGALVVCNDEIHAARFVTKTHTLAPSTFQSPWHGPLGHITLDAVEIPARLTREVITCQRLEPAVDLIKLTVGQDERVLRQAVEAGTRGVVIEALGGGRVPPWWLPAIRDATNAGVTVVIASRTGSGAVVDGYGYPGCHRDMVELGCLFAHDLNGQKARMRLMVVLGATQDKAGTRRVEAIASLWATSSHLSRTVD